MRRKIVTADKAEPLPLGIKASDLAWPKGGRFTRSFELYLTSRFGWCVATLKIGNGRSGPPRTYGASLKDGKIVTMGGGPHILDTKTVYLTEERTAALAKLVEFYEKGVEEAGLIRDRIGSRRAEGQLRRAQGQTFWHWSN
jgi:hypothetical protein